MSDSKKMKYVNLFLLITLQLIESAVGSCQLRATVRTIGGNKTENVQEQIHQTQLQLQCGDENNCPVTNFTTCDTYTDLNIQPGCTGETCSRLFILCENGCINEGQQPPVAPVCPSINPVPSDSSAATTSIIVPTTIMIIEKPTTTTLTTTTTKWTLCPRSTIDELAVSEGPSQYKSCETFTFIKSTTTTVLSPVHLSCTPSPPQPTTPLDKTNTSTTSPALETGSCIQTSASIPAQGASSSNVTSALGALLGLSLVLLTLVTIGWVWTCWTMNKRERQQIYRNTDLTTINAPDVSLDNNPAYQTQTPLQKNIAYEDTTLHTDVPQRSSTQEPTYEIIPPAASANSISEQMLRSMEGGEEYNKLNRNTQ